MAGLYFAYGSNMSAATMAAVAPRHRFAGRARLPGHRLAFTRRSVRTGSGVADVVPDPAGTVWGVVYELGPGDLDGLDLKEGLGWAYGREDVSVLDDDDVAHDAFAFVVIAKEPVEIRPSDEYLQALLAAASERGLPGEYVATLRLIAQRPVPR